MTVFADPNFLSVISGALVGLILALVGGGGSIIAVPLLVYVVGVSSTHQALGTSAIAVALTALVNLVPHWRAKNIKWRCVIVFALAGIIGAFTGSTIAKYIDGDRLLALFGVLMLVVGILMLFKRSVEGDHEVHLSMKTAKKLLPRLIPIGFMVGLLSGFFGIGGGFLIVPGLIFATGMPLRFAIGTSLVAIVAFGATTATNYAISGLVDWRVAALFVAGGGLGGIIGMGIGKFLGKSTNGLAYMFSAIVIIVGGWIVFQGIAQYI